MNQQQDFAAILGGPKGVDNQTMSWLVDWLDDQEAERNELIMRLRRIERNLMKYGRLKPTEARPKRTR